MVITNMGEQTRKTTMSICLLVVLCLIGKQVEAGDLYPEQIGASFQSELPFQDSITLNDTTHNFIASNETENDIDIAWFKTNIVDKYGFVKDSGKDEWKQQGDFSTHLATAPFKAAADRALAFFKRNPNWSQTKVSLEFRKPANGKCLELLYITAARYLLVTYILWVESGKKMIQCQNSPDKKLKIPASVCYPMPYGSATCTSDYDVGLVGKDSGFLTKKFNDYFESSRGFGKPSEKVFDTNVYAFTLEYAMPAFFSGLPANFAESVAAQEETVRFKMQELVCAYYKVFKYNQGFFDKLSSTAKASLKSTSATQFDAWNKKFSEFHEGNPLAGHDIRLIHNQVYQEMVKGISERGGYGEPEKNLENLAVALLYAAEAYHTRGAIRHIVGGLQIKDPAYSAENLPMMDLWVSMIENWGETLKEYNHACFDDQGKPVILEICLLKMSKYLWRMLAAMRGLLDRIKAFEKKEGPTGGQATTKLVSFGGDINPEAIMKHWLDVYKRRGLNQVNSNQIFVNLFFERLECPDAEIQKPLPAHCISVMNDKVNAYNKKLADIFSKKHP